MEKEGLKRSLALLEERGVTLDSIVTDRHPQIQKFLREANVTQYYDVWHMEKGILYCVCVLEGDNQDKMPLLTGACSIFFYHHNY